MRKIVAAILCTLFAISLIGCSGGNDLIEESNRNIAPYLEKLGAPLNADGKVSLSSELCANKDSIDFMGMTWAITFRSDDGVTSEIMIGSNDFYTYDEHEAFVCDLSEYFGSEPVVERNQIGEHNTNVYYWTDQSVSCTVKFYTSVRANHEDERDRFELYWSIDEEIPE